MSTKAKGIVESPLKRENALDLSSVEDQIRVDDEMLAAELPDRQSIRNRVIYNPTSKASLPGRMTSRNRTIFKKDISNLPRGSTSFEPDLETTQTKQDSQKSKDLRRIKLIAK